MVSRTESSLFLSLSLSLSRDEKKEAREPFVDEVREMAKCTQDPNRVPCGT